MSQPPEPSAPSQPRSASGAGERLAAGGTDGPVGQQRAEPPLSEAPGTRQGPLGAFGDGPAAGSEDLGPTAPVLPVVSPGAASAELAGSFSSDSPAGPPSSVDDPEPVRSASPATLDAPLAPTPPLEPTGQIAVRHSLLSVDWLADPTAWAAGSIVGGRYLLLRALGHGGMGDVLLGQDLFLRRKVAIKTLRTNLGGNATAMEGFRQEVAMAHAVAHPGLARTYDLGESDGVTFLTMEYLDGESLWERIQRTGPLPVDEVRRIGVQVARALHAAHRAGVVHRDMKPSNIQLTSTRGAVILDFGLAAGIDRGSGRPPADPARSALVRPCSSTAGTPQYMPPEQWKGEQQGVATDVYAFGAILFEALAGRPPFNHTDELRLMSAHVGEPPPALRSLRKGVPLALERLVGACLSKTPGERPASMAAVADALQPPPWRRHAVTGALCVGVLALSALAGWAAWTSASALVVREMRPAARRLAELAALQVRAADLDAVRTPDDMSRPEFERTLRVLRRLKRDNTEVRFIYTLRVGAEPHLFDFVVDADPIDNDRNGDGVIQDEESGSPPGLEYDGSDFPELVACGSEHRPTADRDFAADMWGVSLSGYAPIARRQGAPGGDFYVVGVDLSNEPVQRLRQVLLTVFALLGLLSLGLVVALRRRGAPALAALEPAAGRLAAMAVAAVALALLVLVAPGAAWAQDEPPLAGERLASAYAAPLRISHVVPAVIPPSGHFAVHGVGFGETQGRLEVAGKVCTVIRWSESVIVAVAPYRRLRGPVLVRAGGEQASSRWSWRSPLESLCRRSPSSSPSSRPTRSCSGPRSR